MSLEKFEGKSLAECKGLQITPVRVTRENGYKCILLQAKGLDYGVDENGKPRTFLCVLLGKALSHEVKVGQKLSGKNKIVKAGNGLWKIGRPEVEFYSAEESPY